MSAETAVKEDNKLTPELIEFAEQWKSVPGNLIMVLHKVQEHFRYIPREAAFEVAKILDVPVAKVYGVLTFYHFFKLDKPGRNQVAVCMGTACYLKGGQDLIEELEQILGVGLNTVTDDGEFSVEAVRCIGCCGLAPLLTVNNNDVYGNITTNEVAEVVAKYRNA